MSQLQQNKWKQNHVHMDQVTKVLLPGFAFDSKTR